MQKQHQPSRFMVTLGAIVLGVAALTAAPIAIAQDDLASRANAAIQASDWERAVTLYSELTQKTPENPAAWYRLGLATSRSGGEGAAARKAFEKALELGFTPAIGLFAVSKSHAMDGDAAAAVEALERLAKQGPSAFVVSRVNGDEAFASLKADKRLQDVLVKLTPCTSEEYRQFDFWLGNWNVLSPQGQTVGTNHVTQAMDGCVLMENWVSAAGGQKGMSINYYDRDKGTWSQIYRDNSGSITQWPELIGGLKDGSMVLDSGPETNPRTRWTWTLGDDGRVRQLAESTTDGETWNVVWDSYYVKMDP